MAQRGDYDYLLLQEKNIQVFANPNWPGKALIETDPKIKFSN